MSCPTVSSSVTFREPDGRISHPGRDSSFVAPGTHSFSPPAVNQPGSGGSPFNVHPNAGSKLSPSSATDRLRISARPADLPYVMRTENQEIKRPPVYTSSPFMTNTSTPDLGGPAALSRVVGCPSAGTQSMLGPELDRSLPKGDSSSLVPNVAVPVPGSSEATSGNPTSSSSDIGDVVVGDSESLQEGSFQC